MWDNVLCLSLIHILIAGKQDAGNVSALLKAFQKGQVQQAYGDALNSDGYAMQEQARWLDSLEAKTQQLEAAFQSLSNTVLGSDVLKVLADGGVGVINTLDSIIDKLGLLGTLSVGASAIPVSYTHLARTCSGKGGIPIWTTITQRIEYFSRTEVD